MRLVPSVYGKKLSFALYLTRIMILLKALSLSGPFLLVLLSLHNVTVSSGISILQLFACRYGSVRSKHSFFSSLSCSSTRWYKRTTVSLSCSKVMLSFSAQTGSLKRLTQPSSSGIHFLSSRSSWPLRARYTGKKTNGHKKTRNIDWTYGTALVIPKKYCG